METVNIRVEFERFSKEYTNCTYEIIPVDENGHSVIRITEKNGKTHNYNMDKVQSYHTY